MAAAARRFTIAHHKASPAFTIANQSKLHLIRDFYDAWRSRTPPAVVHLSEVDQNQQRQVLLAARAVLDGTSRRVRDPEPKHLIRQEQHRLNSGEIEQIAAEYRAGGTLPQIAKRWRINRETAPLALTRAGEPVRDRAVLTPSMLDEAVRLRAEGWSLNRLRARFGVDYGFLIHS